MKATGNLTLMSEINDRKAETFKRKDELLRQTGHDCLNREFVKGGGRIVENLFLISALG